MIKNYVLTTFENDVTIKKNAFLIIKLLYLVFFNADFEMETSSSEDFNEGKSRHSKK